MSTTKGFSKKMAGKEADFSQEVLPTVNLIRDLWGDFPITKDNILNPTSEFVTGFYRRVVSELQEHIQTILPGMEYRDEADHELIELGGELVLYTKLVKFFKQFHDTAFYLTDLYDPQAKRTNTLFKFAVHSMVFVNNNVEEFADVAVSALDSVTHMKNLQAAERRLREDQASNAERVAESKIQNTKLQMDLQAATAKHEEMQLEKDRDEKLYVEKLLVKQQLATETDDLDYKLKHLETKEKELENHIVTDEEFAEFKKMEQFLKLEVEQFGNLSTELDLEIDQIVKTIKNLEENLKVLEKLDWGFLTVTTLHDLRKQAGLVQNNLKHLKEEMDLLQKTAKDRQSKVKRQESIKEDGRELYNGLSKKYAEDEENEIKLYEAELEQHNANLKEAESLKALIAHEEGEIEKVRNTAQQFNKHCEELMEKIFAMRDKVVTKYKTEFENMQ